MARFLVVLYLAAGLAACASQQRMEPPAPIETAGKPSAPSNRAPAAEPSSDETVEVYAYRPPSAAPDAVAQPGSVPADGGLRAESDPVSERPNTGSAAGTDAGSTQSGPASGTGSSTQSQPSSSPAPTPQVVAYASPALPAPSLPPAADALAKQAEQQRQARDYVGAAATLERALRIEPQEAYLWNRLARVRMEQGNYSQAGDLASRSNALSRDQVQLKQDNWSIISNARRAAGDSAGAMEAEQKARGG